MSANNKISLVAATIQRVRDDVLSGSWVPGQRLPLVPLAKRYNTSTTVMREALMQMSNDFLITNTAKQGFSVPYLSLEELSDLNLVRCHAEELALRLAIERGDLMWESSLVAVHHRLKHTERFGTGNLRGISQTWLDGAKEFHRILLAACNIPVLTALADALEDATSLYRLWAVGSLDIETRDMVDEHETIVDAVVRKDADAAVATLHEHYNESVNRILEAGLQEAAIAPTK